MADGLFTAGSSVSLAEARLDLGGLLALQGPTELDVRTGVMAGPGATALVTGTAATAPWTVNVAQHHWVTSRGSANGPYLGTKEALTAVQLTAPPASNSRIDVVYSKQQDATAGIPTPDAVYGELYAVQAGTASATPVKPTIPPGAVELATVTILSTATAGTAGAGVTINNTVPLTVARGAPIPFRTLAEALATTGGYVGQPGIDMATARDLYWNGSTWVKKGGPRELLLANGNAGNSGTIASGSATVVSPIAITVPVAADTARLAASIAVSSAAAAAASVTITQGAKSFTRSVSITAGVPVPVDFDLDYSLAAGSQPITVTLTWISGGAVGVAYSSFHLTI
jgi:hypothetical protein